MTRWEWFEDGYGLEGVNLGIVRPDIYAKYIRFKVYLDLINQGYDKGTAIELAGERTRCNRATIYRALEFFATTRDNTPD